MAGYVSPNETREYNSSKSSYSSKYYDPQKAHDYYLANRELKGYSTRDMSDDQKAAWGYTKNQIQTEKKQKQQEIDASYQQQVARYRQIAQERRAQLAESISQALSNISDEHARIKAAAQLKKRLEQEKIRVSGQSAKEQIRDTSDKSIKQEQARHAKDKETIQKKYDTTVSNLKANLSRATSETQYNAILDKIERALGNKAGDIERENEKNRSNKDKIRSDKSKALTAISQITKVSLSEVVDEARETIEKSSAYAKQQKDEVRAYKSYALDEIRTDLSNSTLQARTEKIKNKEELNETYKAIFDREYDYILENV